MAYAEFDYTFRTRLATVSARVHEEKPSRAPNKRSAAKKRWWAEKRERERERIVSSKKD